MGGKSWQDPPCRAGAEEQEEQGEGATRAPSLPQSTPTSPKPPSSQHGRQRHKQVSFSEEGFGG